MGRTDTEIDWTAYMQEVGGAIGGEHDYTRLEGSTGPLVYPAGFVYIFGTLHWLTSSGANIRLAQYFFAALYQTMLACVLCIYGRTKKTPPYMLVIACFTSYRIHSIFVLRLFNDPVAMVMLYAAMLLFLYDHWTVGCLCFSVGVSIKMNVLLYAPGLLILLLSRMGPVMCVAHLALCAFVQLVLAAPFLWVNPWGYISRAFDFSRVFLYQWTVNWRLVDEELFLDKRFHLGLLVLQLTLLATFAVAWTRPMGGLCQILKSQGTGRPLKANYIAVVLASSNLIGMACSRSLHYQFYVWYYHTIPLLVWCASLPLWLKVALPLLIEVSWNTYPSTPFSSGLLHLCHGVLLFGLWHSTVFTRPIPTKEKSQ